MMQVNDAGPVSFEAKRRFITPKMKDNIKNLLTRMNSEVVEKKRLTMQGFTEKGWLKMCNLTGHKK